MTQTFTFRLTAQGVQQLEQELQSLGARGQAAFGQLQAAAASAGASIGGGAGAGAASGGGRGIGGGGNFTQGMQQAGFQIQDFLVQVQGGQSAFVAFAQQGSQLASAFAGGLAGLGVAVASMAAQFVFASTATAQAASASDAYNEASKLLNDLLQTQEQRIRAVNNRLLEQAQIKASAARQTLGTQQGELAEDIRQLEALLGGTRPGLRGGLVGGDLNEQARIEAFGSLQAARQELAGIEQRLAQLDSDTQRVATAPEGSLPGLRDLPGSASAARVEVETLEAALARLRRQVAEQTGVLPDYLGQLQEAERITESVRTAEERYADTIANLNRLREAGVISAETYGRAVGQAQDQIERADGSARRAADAARQLGLAFSSAFEDAIVRGKSLSDVLQGLAQDLARLVIRQTVTEPLAGAARDALGSIDLGSVFGSIFGGARANGGPVSAGRAYLVGERGPEIMLAGASGTVVPNNALGGGVTVQQSFDFRGADASTVALLRAEAGRIQQATLAAIEDRVRRGGSFARNLRGR